jgi:hypothetical protein
MRTSVFLGTDRCVCDTGIKHMHRTKKGAIGEVSRGELWGSNVCAIGEVSRGELWDSNVCYEV